MSVLKQNYIVERFDGETCEFNGDIHKLVEKYKDQFRQMVGTAFNMRKPDQGDYRWDRNRTSYYMVDVAQSYCNINYSRSDASWYWTKDYDYYRRAVDCKYIIRDGFGRVVHPDVIYQAYLKEFGALKTKFTQSTYISKWGGMRSHGDKRRDRGKKNGCYGRRRSKINSKQLLSEYTYSLLNIDEEPRIRSSKSYRDILECYRGWDCPYRHVDRSWKTQTKAKKQWMKRV